MRFGGGRTIECALQNQFWTLQRVGLVWSVPMSSKDNAGVDAWGGGERIMGAGYTGRRVKQVDLANWRLTTERSGFLRICGGYGYHAQNPCFRDEKRKTQLTQPNVPVDHLSHKIGPTFFTENAERNGLKSQFFAQNCSVLLSERQFAKSYLFQAHTGGGLSWVSTPFAALCRRVFRNACFTKRKGQKRYR